MKNRFERHPYLTTVVFLVGLVLFVEIGLSAIQLVKYKKDIKPYYVTPVLRPIVRLFVKDDFVPRTLSMYEWPWNYKTDRARPGHYEKNPLESKFPSYTINSFGLRGKEFTIPKPAGTFRIAIFGGSSTFGSESTDEETYPARLEQKLHQQGYPNVEVLNYGAHSKSLYWIAQQYFREVANIQPDLVIINNIRNTFFDQTQKCTLYSDIVTPQKAYFLKVHLFLTDNSLIYRSLRRAVEKVQFAARTTPFVKNEKDVQFAEWGAVNAILPEFFDKLYPDVIEGIYLDAKKRGIKLMMLIEPIHCEAESQGPTCMWGNVSNKVPHYYDGFRQSIAKLQQKYPDLLVLDPVEGMIKLADGLHQDVFFDELHLTPQGNTALADFISFKLISEKLLPKSK